LIQGYELKLVIWPKIKFGSCERGWTVQISHVLPETSFYNLPNSVQKVGIGTRTSTGSGVNSTFFKVKSIFDKIVYFAILQLWLLAHVEIGFICIRILFFVFHTCCVIWYATLCKVWSELSVSE